MVRYWMDLKTIPGNFSNNFVNPIPSQPEKTYSKFNNHFADFEQVFAGWVVFLYEAFRYFDSGLLSM